jgi:hypothetical protein
MAKLWKVLLGLLLSTGVVWAAVNRTTITNILRVEESGGPSAAVIQAPSLASDYTLTLPPNDGDADQLLRTDGLGALTWVKIVDAMVDAAAAISYSKLDLNDAVVNADINSAAGIEYSKLELTDSIVNADINSAAAISYSKLDLANSVTDGDIAAAAGIDASKLGNGDVSDTELSYVNGVTSAIQTQINGKLNLSGGTLTGPLTLNADATGSLEPVTKQQFDAVINGIAWKQPVRAATTVGGTLATSFENNDVVDGVTLATGDRILIKNQGTDSENGIYVVAPSGAPTRTADANDYSELNAAAVIVQEGTANANKGFYQITELTSFSGQSWIQNFGTGLYVADGQGIELNGSTFELELNGSTLAKGASGLSVNQSSLTLDNLGGTLSVNKGGTGAITAGSARSNLGAAALGANSDITAISGLTTALSIAQGGTGQTTAENAINVLVPTQSSNAGKVLQTNGSVVSWQSSATVPAEGYVYSNGSLLQTVGDFSGDSNKIAGINASATSPEYKSVVTGSSGTDFVITHSVGSITFNLPDASLTARGLITTGSQTLAGDKTFLGNLGIGTTSPSSPLYINSTVSDVVAIKSTQSTAKIKFNTLGVDRGELTSSSADAIRFNNGSGSELMTINGSTRLTSATGPLGVGSSSFSSAMFLSAKPYTSISGATLVTSTVVQGFAWVINTTDNTPALFFLTESAVIEVSDPNAVWTTDNTGTNNSFYYSGSQLFITWRGAGTKSMLVFLFSGSSADTQ